MNVYHFQQLWRYFGPRWLMYRLGYAARLRTGLIRRQIPPTDWQNHPFTNFLGNSALAKPEIYLDYRRHQAPPFFFKSDDRQRFQGYLRQWDNGEIRPTRIADELAQGNLRYFEHTNVPVGVPPDWHLNPFTHQRAPANQHWSQVGDSNFGDVKVIWEASRFGFVYVLVRAYWRTGDERYVELFWQLVEDWRQNNPPQQGPNWKCGQETTFRVMAWCFGLYGCLGAEATTADRVARLAQMIAISGQRIEANLNYALSQHNNHGISEGVGLWTIGTLFPELRFAEKWRKIGCQVLEQLGKTLIYDDGSFAQHSVNYQRLMLHDYLWALRLGDLTGEPLSFQLRERVARAGNFLYQIQDGTSGKVPYYGQNDGALILPLNNCDYQDFRPIVQTAHYLDNQSRCYGNGPWDEDLLWLFGPAAVDAPVVETKQEELHADTGGYYTLRTANSFVFTRCGTFRHRPGQADMLHVDLWWQGQNIAVDAGTYSYNALEPWNNPFARTAFHNTVTVDGLDQMERVNKFLWLPWLQSEVHHAQISLARHIQYWEGAHNGYQRLKTPVSYRRGILRIGTDWWLIIDRLNSDVNHLYRLHWLLLDAPYDWSEADLRLTWHTEAGNYTMQMASLSDNSSASLVRADSSDARGWRSPYYYALEPALSVDLTTRENSTIMFFTLFGPTAAQLKFDKEQQIFEIITQSWQAILNWQLTPISSLIEKLAVTGQYEDQLVIN